MSNQIAVLIWLILIVLEVILVIVAISSICIGLQDLNSKILTVGIAGVFASVIVGWGIWVIYPLSTFGVA